MGSYEKGMVMMVLGMVVVGATLPGLSLGKEYRVGDESGWTVGFDYNAWAHGKTFLVGDKLVFKYPEGVHNVYKVNGTQFQNCAIPSTSEPLTSGNDTIVLATSGRKWYICGVGQHCKSGQKLVITVAATEEAPAPSPMQWMMSHSDSQVGAKKRPFFNLFWW